MKEDLIKAYKILIGEETMPLEDYERVLLVRALENATGFQFRNTRDFKEKMEQFFLFGNPGGILKKARKKRGLTQWQLARQLGVTQSAIARMEAGEIPLNTAAISFIKKNIKNWRKESLENPSQTGVERRS